MDKIVSPIKLGMKNNRVKGLHLALVSLGMKIPEKELNKKYFGAATKKLVASLQKGNGLEVTGIVDEATANFINKLLEEKGLLDQNSDLIDKPDKEESGKVSKVFVKGRVTDEKGRPIKVEVTIYRLLFREEKALQIVKTDESGHYYAELSHETGSGSFNILVRAQLGKAQEISSEVIFDAKGKLEIDLTAATRAIPAKSTFSDIETKVREVIGSAPIASLRELETQNDISYLAQDRKLDPEMLSRRAMAARIGKEQKIDPEIIFAFLAQSEPSVLPGSTLNATPDQASADDLEYRVFAGIVSLNENTQRRILGKAVDKDLVSFGVQEKVDDAVKELTARRPNILANARFGAGKKSMSDLLAITKLTKKQQTDFKNLALKVQDEGGRLWEQVEKEGVLPAAKIKDARATFAFGAMSKNHIPFINYAKGNLPKAIAEKPGLSAAMSSEEWRAFLQKGIKQNKEIIPENIDGETDKERVGAFAQMLMERAENSYPTMAAFGRIKERNDLRLESDDELIEAISQVPDMNLRTLNINAIRLGRNISEEDEVMANTLRQSIKIVTGLTDEAVSDLKRAQRAMRLAPNATAAAALIATKQDAAHLIHKRGRLNFIKQARQAGMTELQAGQTFDRAEASYGYLIARFLEYRIDLDKASPLAIGGAWSSHELVAEVQNDPSLSTLFGSLDSCACEWCESVHGPAAYYTDILRWLGERPAISGSGFASARAVLESRRGDLMDILLNCNNADTLMPYIDLTNEILEEAVSPTGTPRQTTWRTEELMAEPEHVNNGAYTLLSTAAHAPGLPFDLSDTEAQTYLAHLRLTRSQVMEAFKNETTGLPAEHDIAAAYFGMAKAQGDIIMNAAPGNQNTYWAFSAPGELVPTASAQTLMARADISYEDLAELLSVEYVNGTAPVSAFHPEFECDLSERNVTNLSVNRLDRMNRFIRLWRQTGWKMWELDRAIMALGGTLNNTTLIQLMQLQRVRTQLRFSVEETIALIAPLDIRVRDWLTGDGRSFYTDIFADRAVQNPPDPDLAISAVTAATPPAILRDKAALLAASISITSDDFALLAPETSDPDIELPTMGGRASLDAISRIYRYAKLAKALRLRVSELLDFVRLMGAPLNTGGLVDPFQSPQTLSEFILTYNRHSDSGLAIAESRHAITYWDETVYGASQAQIEANIEDIRTALSDLRAETIVEAEERAAAIERQLPGIAGFEDAAIRATAISIINDSYADTLANRNIFITAHFGTLMPVATAIAEFAPFSGLPADRAEAIFARELIALEAIYNTLSRTSITAAVAAQTGFEVATAEFLAWTMERDGLDSLGNIILSQADFLDRTADDSAYAIEANSTEMPDIFECAQLIDKIAFISAAFDWSDQRLMWFVENEGAYGLPHLTSLPVRPGNMDATFGSWLTLIRWTAVMNAFPETPDISLPIILDLVGAPTYDVVQLSEDLAVWTQQSPDTLSQAITQLSLTYPGDFQTVEAHEKLLGALEVIKLAGVTPAQLTLWASATVSPAIAQEIKLAAKARNTLDEWLEIAPPLQDRLREAKRVALITYLTTRPASAGPSWADANALFAHFLIDPEMTACRKTSRLVQATALPDEPRVVRTG